MNLPSKPALAALFAQVMKRRYETQDFSEGNREDYVRVAMEGDPVVYLEAAWEHFRTSSNNFRPSPGELTQISKTWDPETKPYIYLHAAIELLAGGSKDPGLLNLIKRFGQARFTAAEENMRPSHIEAWNEINREHRAFVFAKTRMLERNSAPYNPSEARGLQLEGVRDALSLPAVRRDTKQASLLNTSGINRLTP